MTPQIWPRTITRSAATVPVTLPFSPMMTSAAADVALDLAVHLQRALADDLEALADDLEVVADHRLGAGLGRGGLATLRLSLRLRLRFGGVFRLGPALLLSGSSFLGSAVELRVNMEVPRCILLA